MLARVLLCFTSGAFALLVRSGLVRREFPGSAAGSLARILLGLDGGAFAGLLGCVLVRLEGPGARARARRCGRQLSRRVRVGRRGGQRTGQGGPDHAARDQRAGDAGDRDDSLGVGQAALTSFSSEMACMEHARLHADHTLQPRTFQKAYSARAFSSIWASMDAWARKALISGHRGLTACTSCWRSAAVACWIRCSRSTSSATANRR